MAILALWETGFRIGLWKAINFPAPSHVLDATLNMLNIPAGFGEKLHPGWPVSSDSATANPLHDIGSAIVWGVTHPIVAVTKIATTPLVQAVFVSFLRLVIGYMISIAVGAALGMLMWRWKAVDDFIGPLFLGLQTLPSVCWVPLAVLCLGINEMGVLFVLVMGSFSAAALSLRDGLRTIPPLYPRAGLMLGASGWRLYGYVLLPASLPALAGSLRTGFSFAWRSLMGAELLFVVKARGLGFLLQTGRDFTDIAQVVAVMIAMVGIGMVADRYVFAVLQRRVQARFGLA